MAGVICHGDLGALLAHDKKLDVPHRMESVKIFPPAGANPPHLYGWRSEEHTSELQSHSDLVCRLLLEKKTEPPSRMFSYITCTHVTFLVQACGSPGLSSGRREQGC